MVSTGFYELDILPIAEFSLGDLNLEGSNVKFELFQNPKGKLGGYRYFPTLILNSHMPFPSSFPAADQSRVMQEQMTMQAGGMGQDPKQAFKAEWEALEVTEHVWALRNAESEMLAVLGPTGPEDLYHQNQKTPAISQAQ